MMKEYCSEQKLDSDLIIERAKVLVSGIKKTNLDVGFLNDNYSFVHLNKPFTKIIVTLWISALTHPHFFFRLLV